MTEDREFPYFLTGNSTSGNSTASGDDALPKPLYSSVWEWMRGVLIATFICCIFVSFLTKWLDYVHRNQYNIELEQREKQRRSLLRFNDGDEDDGLDLFNDSKSLGDFSSVNIEEEGANEDDEEESIVFAEEGELELLESRKTAQ